MEQYPYEVLYEEYLKSADNPYGYTQFKAIIQEYEKNRDYKALQSMPAKQRPKSTWIFR